MFRLQRRVLQLCRQMQSAAMSQTPELPSPPFIDIAGIHNFRDIGGQPASNGRHVRRGLIFRSADPSKATEAGLKKMSGELGLKEIFDLRSAPEITRDGPEWAGVEVDHADVFRPYGIHRSWVPVFAAEDYGPEQVAVRYKDYTRDGSAGFVKAYADILGAGAQAYGAILRYLARENPSPCLLHCTAGKDRTGVIVALLFGLVGVERERIADEYALTDLGLAPLRPIFTERILKNPALEGNRTGVANMLSSKQENMLATLEMIESQFGGVEEYMRKYCGLSEEEVERVRSNITKA